MALIRKDIRVAFYAGSILVLAGLGYVGVLHLGGDDAAEVEVSAVDPGENATIDPLGDWREEKAAAPRVEDAAAPEPANAPEPAGEPAPEPEPVEDVWGRELIVSTTPVRPVEAAAEGPEPAQPGGAEASLARFGITLPEPRDRAPDAAAREHVIVDGDSLVNLAEQYYGDRNAHDAILAANPHVDPHRLRIGQRLTIPGRGAIEPSVRPGEHVVRPGQTLSDIAAERLGRAVLWERIYELNRDVIGDDPGRLKVGMKLRLPL